MQSTDVAAQNSFAAHQRAADQRPTLNGYTVFDFVDPRPWMTEANCLGVDPELFYPGRGESVTDPKAVCAGCVCREPCLEYALAYDDDMGIWGGTTGSERRVIRRARRRQRFESTEAHRTAG